MRSNLANNVDDFIPDKDIFDELADGRRIQVAAAGVPIPRHEAMRLNLVKPSTDAEKAAVTAAADATETAAEHNRKIAEKRGTGPSENKARPFPDGSVVVDRIEEEPVKDPVAERVEKAAAKAASKSAKK